MKLASKLGLVLALFAALLAFAAPTYAASRTRTITEDQINQSYRVTNPGSRAVTARSVDLQPGQVVVNETWQLPRQQPVQRTWTFVPTLANGQVTWALVAATRNGQPVSSDLVDQVNAQINASWVRFIKNQLGSGRITSLSISDTEMVYTIER
ncbi:MAG: hypothetical protein MUD01_10430 [Chloroflexaceae bacterium]|jgi:hypothetical protein|nr:hypothetical protein [Chloroflexaceae bacterium]